MVCGLIECRRTKDWDLIKRIATHPKIWPFITDDFAPTPHDWNPERDARIHYLVAYDVDELLGLFILFPTNGICWDAHVCMLPSAWGIRTQFACGAMFRWVWEHSAVRRITGAVPRWNSKALAYARRCGMTVYGVNPRAQLKNGELHDLVLFGISRP